MSDLQKSGGSVDVVTQILYWAVLVTAIALSVAAIVVGQLQAPWGAGWVRAGISGLVIVLLMGVRTELQGEDLNIPFVKCPERDRFDMIYGLVSKSLWPAVIIGIGWTIAGWVQDSGGIPTMAEILGF